MSLFQVQTYYDVAYLQSLMIKRSKHDNCFKQIEKVSLTMDTWTTTNRLAILGVTIQWIDDMWNLHERVLAIEELCEFHGAAHMAKVLHEILIDYNLMGR